MNKMKIMFCMAALIVGVFGALTLKTAVVEAHTRTVKITVDKTGFSPASIEVEAGHKVNLVFNRADANNCGGTVVFPKLKIRKALPVGKDVIVSITPTRAGNIAFTCGMRMYKGSMTVTD